MQTESELLLLGVSHKSASVEVRERCSVPAGGLAERLDVIRAIEGVSETFLVSTCNRTEVLVAANRSTDAAAIETALRHVVFRDAPPEAVYAYHGLESVIHLFRVACGLDSLILGESQIFAQVKEAFAAARAAGSAGRLLEPLLQHALTAGKRIRHETAVGSGTLSVARAGVEIASHVFGGFERATVLIVGAGETGQLVARNVTEHDVGRLCFVNRTLENARSAADTFGGEAFALDALATLVPRADLIVVCVEGAPDLVGPQHFADRSIGKRDRPLVLVDLSVPRAVHPGVADRRNVIAYDLDDIARVVDANRQERQRASEEAAPILVAEVHKFLSLRAYASFSPRIVQVRERFEAVREEELDVIAGASSSPEMVQLAHKLTSHLLDVALDELKESARRAIEPRTLDRAYQRFLENQ